MLTFLIIRMVYQSLLQTRDYDINQKHSGGRHKVYPCLVVNAYSLESFLIVYFDTAPHSYAQSTPHSSLHVPTCQ